MKINEGGLDRMLRIAAGLGLIAWAGFLGGPAWAWVGVLPLATGTIGICPLYSMLGLNTCAAKKDQNA